MKAFKISSKDRSILEVDMPEGGTLKFMQEVVGGYIECAHDIDEKNTMYVDEEELLKGPEHFFFYKGAHAPFAGSAIIVGMDDETGDTVGSTLTLAEIAQSIQWLDNKQALEMADRMGI